MERLLHEAPYYLKTLGKILIGWGSDEHQKFSDTPKLKELCEIYGYEIRLVAEEMSQEINLVKFQLYELRRKK